MKKITKKFCPKHVNSSGAIKNCMTRCAVARRLQSFQSGICQKSKRRTTSLLDLFGIVGDFSWDICILTTAFGKHAPYIIARWLLLKCDLFAFAEEIRQFWSNHSVKFSTPARSARRSILLPSLLWKPGSSFQSLCICKTGSFPEVPIMVPSNNEQSNFCAP